MPSRRNFLRTLAAGIGALEALPAWASVQDRGRPRGTGVVGLQLWSLREALPKDLAGTLGKIRAMGFREVESAGLAGHTAAELRSALDAAGLRCQSAHMDFERLRDKASGAFDEAKALGATWVVCPWVPPGHSFTREVALRTAEVFNTVGKSADAAGLRFAYHCHGYEFLPSAEGTLFDTLASATDPKRVTFQIDVFHALLGGADPVALINRYSGRVSSLHLKDLRKGFSIKPGTAVAPPEADVPLGTGQVDIPGALAAAKAAGVSMFYIEDESADPLHHIAQSMAYLSDVPVPQ